MLLYFLRWNKFPIMLFSLILTQLKFMMVEKFFF